MRWRSQSQGNHLFYMPVGVIPELDAKRKILVAP